MSAKDAVRSTWGSTDTGHTSIRRATELDGLAPSLSQQTHHTRLPVYNKAGDRATDCPRQSSCPRQNSGEGQEAPDREVDAEVCVSGSQVALTPPRRLRERVPPLPRPCRGVWLVGR